MDQAIEIMLKVFMMVGLGKFHGLTFHIYSNSVEFGGKEGAKTFHPSNKSQYSPRVKTQMLP